MTLFELVFGLTAVILGLGLTQLASNLRCLMMAGRRVKWAPEPLLLCGIIFLVTVGVWLGQWALRGEIKTTQGEVILQVLKMLTLFMAAAFVLPDKVPEQGEVDLYGHYDRTRAFTYGALILGLLLFWVHGLIRNQAAPFGSALGWTYTLQHSPYVFVSVYTALIVIRARWFHIPVLLATLVWGSWVRIPAVLIQ